MEIGPTVSPDTAPFWRGAQQGQLLLPFCSLGHGPTYWLPPVAVCPCCGNQRAEWRAVERAGVLACWVVYRREFLAEFPAPYTIGLVELASGPRLTLPLPDIAPEQLRAGQAVEIQFRRLAGSQPVPVGLIRPESEACP